MKAGSGWRVTDRYLLRICCVEDPVEARDHYCLTVMIWWLFSLKNVLCFGSRTKKVL